MQITETKIDDSIQLSIEGQVDTITSAQLQQSILVAFQKSKNVILDLEQVPYMSSTGLRALLLGQKTATSKGGTMKVLHVQPAVMQVFQMSGFDSILSIE